MKCARFLFLGLFLLTVSACKKCAECKCINDHTYTVHDSSEINQTFVLLAIQLLEDGFDDQYPEDADAFCDKRQELQERMDDYEEESFSIAFPGVGFDYQFSHDCACSED